MHAVGGKILCCRNMNFTRVIRFAFWWRYKLVSGKRCKLERASFGTWCATLWSTLLPVIHTWGVLLAANSHGADKYWGATEDCPGTGYQCTSHRVIVRATYVCTYGSILAHCWTTP
jgi:hypothetical protein